MATGHYRYHHISLSVNEVSNFFWSVKEKQSTFVCQYYKNVHNICQNKKKCNTKLPIIVVLVVIVAIIFQDFGILCFISNKASVILVIIGSGNDLSCSVQYFGLIVDE